MDTGAKLMAMGLAVLVLGLGSLKIPELDILGAISNWGTLELGLRSIRLGVGALILGSLKAPPIPAYGTGL